MYRRLEPPFLIGADFVLVMGKYIAGWQLILLWIVYQQV